MNLHVVVTAAGEARRFGRDKLWVPLRGKALLYHTLDLFRNIENCGSRILTLSHHNLESGWLSANEGYRETWTAVAGAECREASVFQGLRHLVRPRPEDLVIVHDGARPCLHPGDLQRVINSAREWGAALAVTPVRDTLKRVRNHEVAETVNRDNLVHALTPQIARYDWLKQAFDKAKDLSLFTDESGLLEAEGHQVRTVHLDHPNPKVTFSQDLHLAEVILSLHQRI